ncbi:protein kinase [Bifidobacterium callimiconis]|nr:protein kinase [Bifidobacterium callimiconis]MBT1177031.1 protein kinase [Bifidobacterium callimiconis]
MSDLTALNLAPGNLVGGYTLISRLGGGAMGSVWRVKDDGGNIYAMKILRDSLNDDGDDSTEGFQQGGEDTAGMARERLRREAAALRRVNHPGVCQIVDMELDDSLAFIVTELIEGKNLREDVLANGKYVAGDLERLTRKLIDAVSAVHRAGIIHRDIKPTNVMVSRTGPVLVDFGIAMGEGESHVTRTGLVMGTPGFIAPEIIDGAESDETTDWWSTAAVLAFAATGQPVFGSKPMMAVLERAAAGNANLAGLPPRTTAAFRSALSPRREDRCTPMELLQTIEQEAMVPELWTGVESGTEAGSVAAMASPAASAADGLVQSPLSGKPMLSGAMPTALPPSIAPQSEESGKTGEAGEESDGNRDVNEGGEAGVVRPFGRSSSDNPRSLWKELDERRAALTQVIGVNSPSAIAAPAEGADDANGSDGLNGTDDFDNGFDDGFGTDDEWNVDKPSIVLAGQTRVVPVDRAPSDSPAFQPADPPLPTGPTATEPATPDPAQPSSAQSSSAQPVDADDPFHAAPKPSAAAAASLAQVPRVTASAAGVARNAAIPPTAATTTMPASYPAPVHSYDQLDWLKDDDNTSTNVMPTNANPLRDLRTLGDEPTESDGERGELDHLFDSLPITPGGANAGDMVSGTGAQPVTAVSSQPSASQTAVPRPSVPQPREPRQPADRPDETRAFAAPAIRPVDAQSAPNVGRTVQSTSNPSAPNPRPAPRTASSDLGQTRIIGPDPALGTTTLVQAPTIGEPLQEPPISAPPIAASTTAVPTASQTAVMPDVGDLDGTSADMDATLVYGQPRQARSTQGPQGQGYQTPSEPQEPNPNQRPQAYPQPGYGPDPYAQQYGQASYEQQPQYGQPQYDQYGQPIAPPYPPQQPQPYQPREGHADAMRDWYIPRGRMIMCLLAVPLCLFAASVPAAGLMSAAFLLWAFTVMGLSRNSQLEREDKRGGLRKGTDSALIVGAMPWHLIKGLALTVVPTLLMLALFIALTAFLTTALMLPSATGMITAFGTPLRFPLLAGSALSSSGFTLMACMAAAWFTAALGPYSRFARLGAGTLRGDLGAPSPSIDASLAESSVGFNGPNGSNGPGPLPPEEQERLEQSAHRRGWTLTLIWLVLILAGVAMLLAGGSIDWAPILLD